MFDFFSRLFDTSGFPPRWHCGAWTDAHGWLHILSDLAIWSAYFAIPVVLVYFVLRRRDIPFPALFWLFGAFILACGTTHLMEAIIFWHPLYRLAGVIKLLTALVSWGTVVALVPVVPRALAMRSPEELERQVQERTADLAKVNEALQREIAERKAAEASARQEREQFRVTLASIGDAVIVTDAQGLVTFLNPVAESLTAWRQEDALGQSLPSVFRILNETTRRPAENPAERVLREGVVVGLANHTILIAKDGNERAIDDSAAPIRHGGEKVLGVVLVFRDVSQRRQFERLQQEFQSRLEQQVRERTTQLQASEERFRLLVEGNRECAIFMLDPTGHVASWNPGAATINGYQAEEIIGQHFSRFYPPEDIQAGKPARELEIAQRQGQYEEEGWRLRKDGSRLWANVLISALFDAEGRLRGFSKVTRDLTQRKQAEEDARRLIAEQAARQEAERHAEEMAAQREQLRVTLESIGDGVIATDALGNVTLLNPVAQALTGWKPEEASGQPLEQVFHIKNEITGQPAENPVARVLQEGIVVGLANHTVLIARDGTQRPIEDSAAPIRDGQGKVRGVVLVFHDVTEQRRTEREARQAEERMRSVVNHLVDGVISIDEVGTVVTFNPAAERTFGYAAAEVVGRNVKMLMPEPYHTEHDSYLTNFLRGGPAKIIGTGREVDGRRKDGSTFPMDLAVSEFHLGERRHFTGIVRDISDRKRAEEALKESAEDLARSNRELSAKVEEQTTLLDILPGGVIIADPLCHRITGNRAFNAMVGLPQGANASFTAEQPDLPAGIRVLRNGRELPADEFPMQVTGRTGRRIVNFDHDLVFPDGRVVTLLANTAPLLDQHGAVRGVVGAYTDITERKRAEETLRLQGQVAANLAEGVTLTRTRDGVIMYTNAQFDKMFGYGPGELLGKHVSILNAGVERDPGETARAIMGALREKGAWKGEVHNVKKDGTPFWTEASASTFEHPEFGTVWVSARSDITERKRAELALRASEAQQRAILASLPAHIAVVDRAGRILAVNPAWEQFARANEGVPDRCNVGANYFDVCRNASGPYSEEAPRMAEGLKAVLEGTASEFHLEYPCHGNQGERWFLLHATRLQQEAGGAVLSHVNITDRVKAEQRARTNEHRLEAILESAADAIITTDHRGIIQSVNRAAERMFGYAAAEMLGQNVSMLMSSPYREAHAGYMASYAQTKEKQIIGISRELDARRKDGSVFPTDLAVSEIEHLGLFTCIHRDLTERKQLERDVVEIASEEQRRIGQDLHDTVSQELTALGIDATHLAETLQTDPAHAKDLVEKMIQGLRRSQRDLRAVMRGLVPVSVDTEGLMAALAELADRTQKNNKLTCTFDCPKPVSLADNLTATHLYLIAQEAVHNALKHAAPKNLLIRLEANDLLSMCVQDDGIGFPEANRSATGNDGLGLRIMRNRAAIIGASLAIERVEPTGTRVCVLYRGMNNAKEGNHQKRPDPDR